jgi:hypothetical protein
MPWGHNLATCSDCGKPYITGDCIELGEKCDRCKATKVVDLTHLVPKFDGGSKEKLKQVISTITNDALAGVEAIYRYKRHDGASYIRWGIVSKHIDAAIDLYWPKEEKEDE